MTNKAIVRSGTDIPQPLTLQATNGKSLVIRHVDPPTPPPSTPPSNPPKSYLYAYEVVWAADGSPICGVDSISNTNNPAFLVPGTWTESGEHIADRDRFSFACENSAVIKCIEWEYAPWPTQLDRDRHQACTRMARGDHFGDGEAHTVNGFTVSIYDDLDTQSPVNGISESDVNLAHYSPDISCSDTLVEGAWSKDGSICQGQQFWQTFPVGFLSPDPRNDSSEPFCNAWVLGNQPDWTLIASAKAADALVFNSSGRDKSGLYRWERWAQSQTHHFTTSRGFCGGVQTESTVPPAPHFTTAHYEGALLTDCGAQNLIRQGVIKDTDIEALHSWQMGTEYATTKQQPPGYQYLAFEGYVFTSQTIAQRYGALHHPTMTSVELIHYRNKDLHYTSTGRPPPGYRYVNSVGWILEPSEKPKDGFDVCDQY